jgi:enoyl-[acyl-carrier-protein] reductase (NADH)
MPNTIYKPENLAFFSTNASVPELIKSITPLKRMGTSDDVAKVVEFFCSPKSNFITGQSLHVDGGLSIVSQEYVSKLSAGNN